MSYYSARVRIWNFCDSCKFHLTSQNLVHIVVTQGKNAELEQIVKQKELEIERLQQQLESKKSSGSSDSSVDVCAAVELDEDPTTAYAHEVSEPSIKHSYCEHMQVKSINCCSERI